MPLTWALADPKLSEREVAAQLCAYAREHDLLTAGVVLIGDKASPEPISPAR